MASLVVDASVAASWFFPDEKTGYTNGVLLAISGPYQALAPGLWAYEIRNSILIGCRRGRITQDDVAEFLGALDGLQIGLSDPPSYAEVYRLAEAHDLTVYDAAYLELARREDLPLASLDKRLNRAAVAIGVELFDPGA